MADTQRTNSTATDLALMQRLADGDEMALSELYDKYSGHVYSVALRVLKESAAAEEVLQDIFYKLWEEAPHFDPQRGSLPGWLVVIARHQAISRLRKHNPLLNNEWSEDLAVTPENFSGNLDNRLMLDSVRSVVEKLPDPQRQALDLAYFEGLTHTEIAEKTGEPLGTIKTRLRSALKTLREVLNP